MAYVGNTARLCQAIIDGDLEHVHNWCSQEGVDINCRDYCGRTVSNHFSGIILGASLVIKR